MKSIVLSFLSLSVASSLVIPQRQQRSGSVNPAVTSLNVNSYLGLWYEMYADAYVLSIIQRGAYCAQALYGLNTNGSVSVYNYQTDNAPNGAVSDIYGYATIPDPSQPGELLVNLQGTPVAAPYWVIALGPVVNGFYEWAIVSDNKSLDLFILARDPATFQSTYAATVVPLAESMGFKPIAIYQQSDCVYFSTSASAKAAKVPQSLTAPPLLPASSTVNPAVTSLNVNSYLGLWYEMYADAYVLSTFQRGAYCAQALYGLNTNGSVSVYNYQTDNAPNGAVSDIYGYATIPDPSQPGELLVYLQGVPGAAPYWVLALGPVVNGYYEWAIVSDDKSIDLFILARNPTTFQSIYAATVVPLAESMGFKPIAIYQQSDCVYFSTSASAKAAMAYLRGSK